MRKRPIAACTIVLMSLVFVGLQFFAGFAKSDETQSLRTEPKNGASRPVQKEDAVNRGERRLFMRSKRAMVQKVVEGIATEDFGMVEQGGMELVAIAETAAPLFIFNYAHPG